MKSVVYILLAMVIGFFGSVFVLERILEPEDSGGSLVSMSAPAGDAGSLPEPAVPAVSVEKKEWTIMVYMSADNNLEANAIADFLEMEQGITGDMNILVLMDRPKKGIKFYDNSGHAKLFRIRKAPAFNIDLDKGIVPPALSSELIKDYGELDLSDPDNLYNFIRTAVSIAPAERYAFIPWNHGLAMIGLLTDDDGGSGRPGKALIRLKDFSATMQKAAKLLPRKKFDLVYYYLCLMGQMDVMAETYKFADYAIASPPSLPMVGTDFTVSLKNFAPGISTADTAKNVVKETIESIRTNSLINGALSAYDLSVVPEITAGLHDLAAELKALAPKYFGPISKTMYLATHLQDLESDFFNGKNSSWSIRLDDWLAKLKKNVPGISSTHISRLQDAVSRMVLETAATEGAQDSRFIGIYLPINRQFLNPLYDKLEFSRSSGIMDFLNELYTAQKSATQEKPTVENIEIGTYRLRDGSSGRSADDFEIRPKDVISPLSKYVVRFNVKGTNISSSKVMNLELKNGKRIIDSIQLVTTNRIDRQKALEDETNGFYASITPDYRDGDNYQVLEVSGVKYKLYQDGSSEAYDVSVVNMATSSRTYENLSYVYAMYTDDTLGGREFPVVLKFFNTTHQLYTMMTAGPSVTQLVPRVGGTLRLGRMILDEKDNITTEYGAPVTLRSLPCLTLDLIEDNTQIQMAFVVNTLDGEVSMSMSKAVTIRTTEVQKNMIQNTMNNWRTSLTGVYSMLQYITFGNEFLPVPNFNILVIRYLDGKMLWELYDSKNELLGNGLYSFNDVGVPILHLFKDNAARDTVETWYAFLEGTGTDKQWYLVNEVDGTRSLLIPLKRYQDPAFLTGSWRSSSELWHFNNGKVEYMRLKEKLVAKGTYTIEGDMLHVDNFPFDEYAFYYDHLNDQLTLVTRDHHVSVLRRVSTTADISSGDKPSEPVAVPVPVASGLEGNWTSGSETGNAHMTVTAFPGTPYYSMQIISQGQGTVICSFSVRGNSLDATFPNGTKEVINFSMNGPDTVTLYFPNMPPITFFRN